VRRLFASIFTLAILTATPAQAVMEDYPSVKLQGLDKSVGRTVTFEAKVGSTIQYGPLFIKIHACRKAPPIEKPESAAFLQIWEVPPGAEKSEWVFSGWMFASSPALSAMDHPVYDVWVLDCLGKEEPNAAAEEAASDEDADQTDLEPADENADIVPDAEAEDQSPVEETPVDGEAEDQSPVEAPADAPVDSEAEDQTQDGAATATQPDPGPTPETALDPQTETPPANPETDPGFTVYDMIKQGGGKVPAPAPNGQNPPGAGY